MLPTEAGTPFRIGNYLKRILKPIGAGLADIPDLTFQAMRRTFATHFQRYGSPKDGRAQLRHSKLEMTGFYMKEILGSARAAVERMDADICKVDDSWPFAARTSGSLIRFVGGFVGVPCAALNQQVLRIVVRPSRDSNC